MRILSKGLHILENMGNFFFIHSNDRLYYISFHISGKCVRILSFLDNILKFSWKSKKIHVLGIELIVLNLN
jgi:hypothetical protein